MLACSIAVPSGVTIPAAAAASHGNITGGDDAHGHAREITEQTRKRYFLVATLFFIDNNAGFITRPLSWCLDVLDFSRREHAA